MKADHPAFRLAAGVIVGALAFALLYTSGVMRAIALPRLAPALGGVNAVWLLLALLTVGAFAALSVAVRAERTPPLLGGVAAVLLLAAYGWSNLDWFLLANRAVAPGGVPQVVHLAWPLAALGAALVLRQHVLWGRVEARYLAKGVEPAEAAEARKLSRLNVLVVAGAAGAALAVVAVFHVVASAGVVRGAAFQVAWLYPMVAVAGFGALLAFAARRSADKPVAAGVPAETEGSPPPP